MVVIKEKESESEVSQSCPTLCNSMDCSPPSSSIHGILQARTLEWVAIFFSNAWKWKVKGKSLSHVWLLATPWTAAHQAPLSMGLSRQEYWSVVPLPSPEAFSKSKQIKQKRTHRYRGEWSGEEARQVKRIANAKLLQSCPTLKRN